MKEFIEVQFIFKQFDENIVLVSGEFNGTDPWGDDIYEDDPVV